MNELLDKIRSKQAKICVVGLGYVGLPTAIFFAENGFDVVGCDLSQEKVDAVNSGISPLDELGLDRQLKAVVSSGKLKASADTPAIAKASDIVLVIVPTPVTPDKAPDLRAVRGASEAVAKGLHKGMMVILESTVYPGVTEEVMQPILEATGLKAGEDFGLGYCPERYNPGDPERTIDRMARIVSGITPEWAAVAKELYSQITSGEVTAVRNIKTAEAGKVIENIQRDLNIALMNELALVFEKMDVDIIDVINAASTKWNFHPYWPGPGVGGHCIPVDPYYLVYKAKELGYEPHLIAAGRVMNNAMPAHMVDLVKQGLEKKGTPLSGAKILVMGYSYKPDVGDPRETPGEPILRGLRGGGADITVLEPHVDTRHLQGAKHCKTIAECGGAFDAFVLITYHSDFKSLDWKALSEKSPGAVVVDGPRKLSPEQLSAMGFIYLGVGAGDWNEK